MGGRFIFPGDAFVCYITPSPPETPLWLLIFLIFCNKILSRGDAAFLLFFPIANALFASTRCCLCVFNFYIKLDEGNRNLSRGRICVWHKPGASGNTICVVTWPKMTLWRNGESVLKPMLQCCAKKKKGQDTFFLIPFTMSSHFFAV